MAIVGYARVSSVGQTLDVQLSKLQHCDKIFQEKKSGASSTRPRLSACLEYVRGKFWIRQKVCQIGRRPYLAWLST